MAAPGWGWGAEGVREDISQCQPKAKLPVVVAEVSLGHETESPGAQQDAFLTHGKF